MKLVVDTNRLMAALLKDGTTREIVVFSGIEFVTPEHCMAEILKHKDLLLEKSGLNKDELELQLQLIIQNVRVVPVADIKSYMKRAMEIIGFIDKSDAPFIACVLATNADGVWSHDLHFKEQNVVKTYTNIDLVKYLKKG